MALLLLTQKRDDMNGPGDTLDSLKLGITKRYGNKTVLDNLELDIQKGEFVTFLGPSGCGKSTALSIVAGLIAATEGEIRLNGARVDHLPPEKRAFGMVFQNYALFPHMTVFDNVSFGLTLKPLSKEEIKKRTDAMLKLVQLTGYEDRYPGQLSGGQQQRVAIARALVLHPRLMLFDEPLSNLDAKLRVEMRAEIKQIHAALGLTSIYVTHDQAEALSLSDRIVVLRNGVLMQSGTPQEIHDRPKNVFVADFMGFRNFFKVRIASVSDGIAEGVGDGIRIRARAGSVVRADADMVMAIRPDDIRAGTEVAPGTENIRGQVEVVEYLGREQEAAIRINDNTRVWLRTAQSIRMADTIGLQFPIDKVVLLPAE
ncbi:ABC transporter ATP-binding protein [Tardiphaga sp. P9-11]|uniref:ABC transporter ATP-binding protein n=1 Tax=Tardiphaga sp. P9-11 TaxID=2024614 RepID=UPI001FEF1743|nr:ABC transporter ATP-binding protein [Tardiphaga sp. P9-11]